MCKILIIDDEEEICALLSGILRKKGYYAVAELTIKGGFNTFREDQFDVVFLDLNLSDGNGYDLIPRLKQENPGVNIFVISAYDGHTEREKALNYGATDFIGKPFSRNNIAEILLEHNKLIQ